ncbi:MAG: hypothetical protein HYT42_02170 [Candidatus Sungbacteria bacterium]|nr:hypothetical protein [Candidatus Sungbacteria bacterium]
MEVLAVADDAIRVEALLTIGESMDLLETLNDLAVKHAAHRALIVAVEPVNEPCGESQQHTSSLKFTLMVRVVEIHDHHFDFYKKLWLYSFLGGRSES